MPMTVPKPVWCLAGIAAVVGAAWVALGDDALIRRSVASAAAQNTPPALDEATPTGQRSGDEGYWLSRADAETPAPFPKMVTVGDHITIGGTDGARRDLIVEEVRTLQPGITTLTADQDGPTLLVVTARVVGSEPAQNVRFLIDQAAPAPAAAPAAPKRRAL